MSPMDLQVALIAVAGTVVVALISGASAFLVARHTAKGQNRTADAAVQHSINDGFETLNKARAEERTELLERIDELTGYVRQVVAHFDGLETILRENGIHVPPRPFPHPLAVPSYSVPRPMGWGAGKANG
jgi:hypothetical protein